MGTLPNIPGNVLSEKERAIYRFQRIIRLSKGQLRKVFLGINHKDTEKQRGPNTNFIGSVSFW